MNRRVIIGIIIAVVGVGLIGLGILAINTILRQSFAPPVQPTPVAEATVDIIITTRDLAIGNVISQEDVLLTTVPLSLAPRNAILTIDDALGKMTMVHLVQGEMLLQHHLADPTNVSHDIGYIINKDEVLMAFPAADLMSGLGVLQRGDLIDIFASMTVEVSPTTIAPAPGTTEDQEKISRLFTFDAFQQVQLTAIVADVVVATEGSTVPALEGSQAPPPPTTVNVRAYLLAMKTQDALVLKHMRDTGAIFDFVLRSPTSNELFDVDPVTVEYLLQRFELMVPK